MEGRSCNTESGGVCAQRGGVRTQDGVVGVESGVVALQGTEVVLDVAKAPGNLLIGLLLAPLKTPYDDVQGR